MNAHPQIRAIAPFADNPNLLCLIQYIDDVLLHLAVLHVVQRIDLHRFAEDFFKIRADQRNRICYDRKAALIPRNIRIRHLPQPVRLVYGQLILILAVHRRLRFHHRFKGGIPKYFNYGRTRMALRLLLIFQKCLFHRLKTPFHICFIQVKRSVRLMIKHKLLIDAFCITAPQSAASAMNG